MYLSILLKKNGASLISKKIKHKTAAAGFVSVIIVLLQYWHSFVHSETNPPRPPSMGRVKLPGVSDRPTIYSSGVSRRFADNVEKRQVSLAQAPCHFNIWNISKKINK